jgi:FdrA protein
VGVVLLDVVLGQGAHPDPASELAPVIASARSQIVVALIGADGDPQDLARQEEVLRAAGAATYRGLQGALEHCVLALLAPPEPLEHPVELSDVEAPFASVNVGLESFHRSLLEQGARSAQVDWRPPAGGDERLAGILERMRSKR